MAAIFSFRLILFTLLIYFFHKSSTLPAYFLIILEFAYLIFMVGGHPHKRSFDTVRAAIIEAGLLYILSMRYLEIELFAEYMSPQSKLYPAIAYTEYVFYALAVGLSVVATGYHLLKNFRKKEEETPESVYSTQIWRRDSAGGSVWVAGNCKRVSSQIGGRWEPAKVGRRPFLLLLGQRNNKFFINIFIIIKTVISIRKCTSGSVLHYWWSQPSSTTLQPTP